MGRPSKYREEFRREVVGVYRNSERSRFEVARSLGTSGGSLAAWEKLVEETEAPGAMDTDERTELARFRKEHIDSRMDRVILRKVATCFARVTFE